MCIIYGGGNWKWVIHNREEKVDSSLMLICISEITFKKRNILFSTRKTWTFEKVRNSSLPLPADYKFESAQKVIQRMDFEIWLRHIWKVVRNTIFTISYYFQLWLIEMLQKWDERRKIARLVDRLKGCMLFLGGH